MVGISEDIGSVEEIGHSMNQCREVAVIRCVQGLKRGQNFHNSCFSTDFHNAAEYDAVRGHAFHNPD